MIQEEPPEKNEGGENLADIGFNMQNVINNLVNKVIDDIAFSPEGHELISDHSKVKSPAVFVKVSKIKHDFQNSVLTMKLLENKGKKKLKNIPLEPIPETDPNYFKLSVQILDTDKTIEISASKEHTVDQIIRHIFYTLKNEPEYKDSIVLPHLVHNGYELRITFDGEIIYDMQPLSRNRTLEDINLDTVAFCINREFNSNSGSFSTPKKIRPNSSTQVYIFLIYISLENST